MLSTGPNFSVRRVTDQSMRPAWSRRRRGSLARRLLTREVAQPAAVSMGDGLRKLMARTMAVLTFRTVGQLTRKGSYCSPSGRCDHGSRQSSSVLFLDWIFMSHLFRKLWIEVYGWSTTTRFLGFHAVVKRCRADFF
jgi:hypothetical protein